MSIKSLFENIADAIKDKNPNIANVTPAEMPSAIRSIPSGSSTAGGVTYDNTASGLTANNVQDAIDELAEDVSTIYSDLSELNNKIKYKTVTGTTDNYGRFSLDISTDNYVISCKANTGSIVTPIVIDSSVWWVHFFDYTTMTNKVNQQYTVDVAYI